MSVKSPIDFISQSPEQTLLTGEHLGAACRGGEIVWLSGALGAGKTVLTQGIARGLEIEKTVTSPTFTVLKEYAGRLNLFHFDFYRLETQTRDPWAEFSDYLRSDAVCVVEWAEHGLAFLGESYLRVNLRYISFGKRAIQLVAHGNEYDELLHRFQSMAFRA
ncbi:MAG: tRNA (adenosine(37)-N6)-threonylcarbamoyltransferase complex ATPase subunit type 1 TsaE [Chloroflexota bacterium]